MKEKDADITFISYMSIVILGTQKETKRKICNTFGVISWRYITLRHVLVTSQRHDDLTSYSYGNGYSSSHDGPSDVVY